MKKYLLAFTIIISTYSQAQDVADAIRYAQDNPNGSARFRAMGGAFGALGGDLSSININPAGSVVFANNQIVFSGSSFNTKNNATFFGTNTTESNNSLDINQLGGVLIFENNKENSQWKKFSLAVNYENVANFDNSLFSAGTNANSIDRYFLSHADGLKLSIVDGTDYYYDELTYREQQAYLGYGAYIINESSTYNDATDRSYVSLVAPGGNYKQENTIETSGYNGKLSVNAAAQYQDKLLLGLTLNSHFTDYRKYSNFYETNNNNTSANDLVNKISFVNDLYTYGSGFSFQLGAIIKPVPSVRMGLSYQSPTWFTLNDELKQSISAVSGNNTGDLPADVVNPNTTMVYAPYKLKTPGKMTGSFAYLFGKRGLISFDYSLKNYGYSQFSPINDSYFQSLNTSINKYSRERASEYSLGAEYRIKQISLRGGYHFEQSPYKNVLTKGNLNAYSGGIGYNFGNKKLDLAYTSSKIDYNSQLFSQGLTDSARINTTLNNVTVTFAFEL